MRLTRWHIVSIALATSSLALLLIAALIFVLHSLESIRLTFADEQVQIFDEMRTMAAGATADEARGYLDYVRNYYPSGTKQDRGSRLDRIVEYARGSTIREIERMLEEKEKPTAP